MIMGIDAGSTESGWVLMDESDYTIKAFGKEPNDKVASMIEVAASVSPLKFVALENVSGYGQRVGRETFDTCIWIGRFAGTTLLCDSYPLFMTRRCVKGRICGNQNKKDKDVRAALVARFAKHDMVNGKGTKKNMDVFYGVSNDVWSAIAVAVAMIDKTREDEERKQREENPATGVCGGEKGGE